ncbi:hypothetical protein NQ318_003516 [Aromia moschata]|uniref:Prolactin receptor n=1 Tax=Aromia moschata TaxID=1265417 RepID=A0AAV8YX36_9CUCU|nr:hypothetical protein NQ318_003516 [Aromia moschata]
MASQSGTRYEDRTMKRTAPGARGVTSVFQRNDDIPMADMAYPESQPCNRKSVPSWPRSKPASSRDSVLPEPLYAQVNMEKKRNRQPSLGNASLNHLTDAQTQPKVSLRRSPVCLPGKDSWV